MISEADRHAMRAEARQFKAAMGWAKSGGESIELLLAEVERLEAAIKKHHAQKADDRCWMDDDVLYEAAGLPVVDRHVGDKAAMLANCERFLNNRCEGGRWPSYAELEKKINGLELHVEILKKHAQIIGGATK